MLSERRQHNTADALSGSSQAPPLCGQIIDVSTGDNYLHGPGQDLMAVRGASQDASANIDGNARRAVTQPIEHRCAQPQT
jgi:hypothetical protein